MQITVEVSEITLRIGGGLCSFICQVWRTNINRLLNLSGLLLKMVPERSFTFTSKYWKPPPKPGQAFVRLQLPARNPGIVL